MKLIATSADRVPELIRSPGKRIRLVISMHDVGRVPSPYKLNRLRGRSENDPQPSSDITRVNQLFIDPIAITRTDKDLMEHPVGKTIFVALGLNPLLDATDTILVHCEKGEFRGPMIAVAMQAALNMATDPSISDDTAFLDAFEQVDFDKLGQDNIGRLATTWAKGSIPYLRNIRSLIPRPR